MRKTTWINALVCVIAMAAVVTMGGCGKDKAGIIRAKMPPRFDDLDGAEMPATVGITSVPYIDLGGDQSMFLFLFLREYEVFKKVRLVESPNAPGCDVIVGGVLEKRGKELTATFRIYKGGVPQRPYVFSIPWNPKGAGKGEEKEVEGVYLSFRGVWSRLAIHLADKVLKIGPK